MKDPKNKPKDDSNEANRMIIQEIHRSMEELDDWTEVNLPNLAQLEDLVTHKKKAMKQAFKKDLMIFLGVAIAILLILSYILNFNPALFIIIQVVSVVTFPLAMVIFKFQKKVNSRDI